MFPDVLTINRFITNNMNDWMDAQTPLFLNKKSAVNQDATSKQSEDGVTGK